MKKQNLKLKILLKSIRPKNPKLESIIFKNLKPKLQTQLLFTKHWNLIPFFCLSLIPLISFKCVLTSLYTHTQTHACVCLCVCRLVFCRWHRLQTIFDSSLSSSWAPVMRCAQFDSSSLACESGGAGAIIHPRISMKKRTRGIWNCGKSFYDCPPVCSFLWVVVKLCDERLEAEADDVKGKPFPNK